ncbi:PhoPQ-activated pathogenicity-related family protein [Phycisphaerales bacterium AB-hyl4]|uniref:PhoPQ-activated pathogenicity-related family protein n=1 Tax=Natronomicrosphaera hydrolytica TaxID=3242702 RepID=A0ABV4U705_9BACT
MWYRLVVMMVLAASTGLALAVEQAAATETALRDYVERTDDTYSYELVQTQQLGNASRHDVRMQSQTWRDKAWQHWMTIIVPDNIEHAGKAVLMIGGGASNSEPPQGQQAAMAVTAANRLGVPVAMLQQVPNQPLFDGMYEDAAIAHTFQQYLLGERVAGGGGDVENGAGDDFDGGSDWPLLLPMVKSAVRAMDTFEQVLVHEHDLAIEAYVLTGASKRGWTSWLTAAVDDRVQAIAPMVIDVLNFSPQIHQQQATYGSTSPMIRDYTERGLIDALDTEPGRSLVDIVDPFAYRDELTLPKLIVLGTNDPYWTVDAANLYVDELAGPTHLAYVPNAGHGAGQQAGATLLAFAERVFTERAMPTVELTREPAADDESITLHVRWDESATRVTLWEAHSPNRDYRQAHWQSQTIETAGKQAEVTLTAPDEGWLAAFVQVHFDDGIGFTLSTPMTVLPEHFPFEP